MKKGKYIDFNILLACLSNKSKAKNNMMLPGTGTTQDHNLVIVYPLLTFTAFRVA